MGKGTMIHNWELLFIGFDYSVSRNYTIIKIHKRVACCHAIYELGFELFEPPDHQTLSRPTMISDKILKVRKFTSNEKIMKAVEVWFADQEDIFFLKVLDAL